MRCASSATQPGQVGRSEILILFVEEGVAARVVESSSAFLSTVGLTIGLAGRLIRSGGLGSSWHPGEGVRTMEGEISSRRGMNVGCTKGVLGSKSSDKGACIHPHTNGFPVRTVCSEAASWLSFVGIASEIILRRRPSSAPKSNVFTGPWWQTSGTGLFAVFNLSNG